MNCRIQSIKFECTNMQAVLAGSVVFGWRLLCATIGVCQPFAAACTKVTGFFGNFETILKVASMSIVTIAIVFAGYQIAFAHKRLSDVAPSSDWWAPDWWCCAIAGWFSRRLDSKHCHRRSRNLWPTASGMILLAFYEKGCFVSRLHPASNDIGGALCSIFDWSGRASSAGHVSFFVSFPAQSLSSFCYAIDGKKR